MSLIEMSLMGVIGFFVICQIFNAIMNLMTAKSFRNQWRCQLDLYEDESRLRHEQFEKILDMNEEIRAYLFDISEWIMQETEHKRFDDALYEDDYREVKPKVSKKRGKYGPRKPKAIEHKEEEDRV